MTSYWISRLVFEKALALIYLVAFIGAVNQFVPLLGSHGLLPVARFIAAVPFRDSPSLFYLFPKDSAYRAAAWAGVALSLVVLTGLPQRSGAIVAGVVWGLMWMLYLSFVNVGQTFYGFGWESLLLEMGFFLIFAGARSTEPSLRARQAPRGVARSGVRSEAATYAEPHRVVRGLRRE